MENEQPPVAEPSAAEGQAQELAPATAPEEKVIDLNTLFPEAEKDLNSLFPDPELKHLLKTIKKNQKDLHAMKDRILSEAQEGSDEPEEEEPAEPQD